MIHLTRFQLLLNATFLLIVGAVLVQGTPSSASAQAIASDDHRYVVLIQGLTSEGACKDETENHSTSSSNDFNKWRKTFTDPVSEGGLGIADNRVMSISYSGHYCGDDNGLFKWPAYRATDTCDGIDIAVAELQSLLTKVKDSDRSANFFIIGHSLGGFVAAYWVSTESNTRLQSVHSVITLESPLGDVPNVSIPKSILPTSVQLLVEGHSVTTRKLLRAIFRECYDGSFWHDKTFDILTAKYGSYSQIVEDINLTSDKVNFVNFECDRIISLPPCLGGLADIVLPVKMGGAWRQDKIDAIHHNDIKTNKATVSELKEIFNTYLVDDRDKYPSGAPVINRQGDWKPASGDYIRGQALRTNNASAKLEVSGMEGDSLTIIYDQSLGTSEIRGYISVDGDSPKPLPWSDYSDFTTPKTCDKHDKRGNFSDVTTPSDLNRHKFCAYPLRIGAGTHQVELSFKDHPACRVLANSKSCSEGFFLDGIEITGDRYAADQQAPVFNSFSVNPKSASQGESVIIAYAVSDSGGSGLKQVELWRKDPGHEWTKVDEDPYIAQGVVSYTGNFSNDPPVAGAVLYGVHAVDFADNCIDEQGKRCDDQSPDGIIRPDLDPIEVQVLSTVDLTVGPVMAPASAKPGQDIQVSFSLINWGESTAKNVAYSVALAEAKPGNQYGALGSTQLKIARIAEIKGGESVSVTADAQVPLIIKSGTYYATVYVDSLKEFGEANESNNIGSSFDGSGLLNIEGSGDTVQITSGPTGDVNPVASGGTVHLSVSANSSSPGPLYYSWVATCPGLPSTGSFSSPGDPNPTWTAPQNLTGSVQSCQISLLAYDSSGAWDNRYYYQDVSPQTEEQPQLEISPAAFDFGSLIQGQTPGRVFYVFNNGTGTLRASVTAQPSWVSLKVDGEIIDWGNFTVNVRDDAPVGNLTGIIGVNSNGGSFNIPVRAKVEAPPPQPALSIIPPSHDFGSIAQGETPSQTFAINNDGTGKLDWEVSYQPVWVEVASTIGPASGEGSVTVTVRPDAPLGALSDTVQIASNGGWGYIKVQASVQDSHAPTVNGLWLAGGMGPDNNQFKTGYSYPIIFNVGDDGGLGPADLLYSPDGDTSWQPIVSGFAIKSNGVNDSYWWEIPADASLTSQARLKIIARDDSGNEATFVSDPFAIINGAPPEVEVLSPEPNEVWDLGSEHTIEWRINSAIPIRQVNIYVMSGDTINFIARVSDGSDSYVWTLPIASSIVSSAARIRLRVTDENDNETMALSDGYFVIRDSSQPPPPPWTAPEAVTSVLPSGPNLRDNTDPVIATGPDGALHMVYKYTTDETVSDIRTITQRLLYAKKTGDSWSPPEEVYSTKQETDASLTGFRQVENIRLAVDSIGTPYFAWQETYRGDINKNEVFYTRRSGGAWLEPFNVSDNTKVSIEPVLAIDASGNAHIIWTDGYSYTGSPSTIVGKANLYYREWNRSTGAWSPTVQITVNGGRSAAVAVDSVGGLHAMFIRSDDIYHMHYDGGGWSDPDNMVIPGKPAAAYLDVAPSSDGALYLTWYNLLDDGAFQGILYSKYNGASWSAPELVSDRLAQVYPDVPSIVVDKQGFPHVIWHESGDGIKNRIIHKVRSPEGWSPRTPISLDSQHTWDIDSAASSDGKVYAVWTALLEGHNEVFLNQADLSVDAILPSVEIQWPEGGEKLSIGSTYTIKWAADDNVGVVATSIAYSRNGSEPFIAIPYDAAEGGSVDWIVPDGEAVEGAQIKVTVADAAGNTASALSNPFSIDDLTPPQVTVLAPNGREIWEAGQEHEIRYTASDNVGVTSVSILMSLDEGNTWKIIKDASPNSGSFTWTAPDSPEDEAKVKVVAFDSRGNVGEDASDSVFSLITPNRAPAAPSNPTPANETADVSLDAALNWSGSDPDDADAVTYSVYFGASGDPPLVAHSLDVPAYNPGQLEPDTVYYWKVTATDGKLSTSGETWSFTTSEDKITLSAAPTGHPNPVASDSVVSLNVEAFDTQGHDLNYIWSAWCPELPSNGMLNYDSARAAHWAAPANTSSEPQSCFIAVNVDDGYGNSASSVFLQLVEPQVANTSPEAADDTYYSAQDTILSVDAPGLLANDTDADDDTLTSVKVSDPAHGSVTLNPDGSFTYAPSSGYTGSDTFTYKASDGVTDSNEAVVRLTVLGVFCFGERPTILGTPGDDIITGAPGRDVIHAQGGNDVIHGAGGDDVVCGGEGNDVIYGESGNDSLYGNQGDDRIYGGNGNDLINGGAGNDKIYGNNGDDTLQGNIGQDSLYGGPGKDTLDGGDDADYLSGADGEDKLYGRGGNDILSGNVGNDVLYGGDGDDTLDGGWGSDGVHGESGNDVVKGGSGSGDGTDWVSGGGGKDQVYGGPGDDFLWGGGGQDKIYGGTGNDTLYGGYANDSLFGEGGDDTLYGQENDDTLNGGGGVDICDQGLGIGSKLNCER